MTRRPQACHCETCPPVSVRGFTLLEALMTVVVIGILVGIAIPTYRKVVEQGYWKQARDLLLTIYSGERAYYFANNEYLPLLTTSGNDAWRKIFMDDPNTSPIAFQITVGHDTFTATATRQGGTSCANHSLTIDQEKTSGGDWSESGVCQAGGGNNCGPFGCAQGPITN